MGSARKISISELHDLRERERLVLIAVDLTISEDRQSRKLGDVPVSTDHPADIDYTESLSDSVYLFWW